MEFLVSETTIHWLGKQKAKPEDAKLSSFTFSIVVLQQEYYNRILNE